MMHHQHTGFAIGDPWTDPFAVQPSADAAAAFFSTLILSASGWRGIFGHDEEAMNQDIGADRAYVAARMADVFADHLLTSCTVRQPVLALGLDTRPTGPAIADTMIRIFMAKGINVRYAFITAAPEIMAWSRRSGTLPVAHPDHLDGFCYISASHNPPGHNGVKFGLADGGVLDQATARRLIDRLRDGVCTAADIIRIATLSRTADPAVLATSYSSVATNKRKAISDYTLFTREIAGASAELTGQERELDALATAIATRHRPAGESKGFSNRTDDPRTAFLQDYDDDADGQREAAEQDRRPVVLADFNGSARILSIDADFLGSLGIRLQAMNAEPRRYAHRIVPEGASLDHCRAALTAARHRGTDATFGYVPDCDGDRGNIVWWDDNAHEAKALEAQETFCLAVLAELAVSEGRLLRAARDARGASNDQRPEALRVAVVANDATSMRIDHVAAAFGARLFRAETGEANVVGLARQLREQGYEVRILGEGSNGGVITHPAAVRDPINTITAFIKLLYLRGDADIPGPFRLWLERTGRAAAWHAHFNMADIMASLPPYTTTSVFERRAALQVRTTDHRALKKRYGHLFRQAWPRLAAELEAHLGVLTWQAMASLGSTERPLDGDFDESGNGGLKILLQRADGNTVAFLWMRGSGTEPVFRVMADVRGNDSALENLLLERHTALVRQADSM
jgi:phosphoglucomutase